MRRGFPSTHIVFGLSQTINAATYMYTKGLEVARALSPKTVAALFGKQDAPYRIQNLVLMKSRGAIRASRRPGP
jgi:geranylgeranyl pyrophosphate synthase